jgi:putative zinc finger/helix-turn-helix YgiT family protein
VARSFPWKCHTCGVQAVNPTLVDYSADMEHDGRSYSITVPGLGVLECERCRARVLTDAAHQELANALRTAAGLLHPIEIRSRREALGLSQRQLAQHLKVAEATVSRWETGGQIQERAMDLLLRGFFEVPEVRRYYAALAGLTTSGTAANILPTIPAHPPAPV